MIITLRRLLTFALLAIAGVALAQPATRAVTLTWAASTTSGVTGYSIATASTAGGPFTVIGCTGTVPGSPVACVSGSTASTTSFTDTETVATTVYYQVSAAAAACTPTTPVSQACGSSTPASASTTIPPRPAITSLIVSVP